MPVNYRIDGITPVTPAIRPTPVDWSPLHNSIELNKRRQEEKAAKAAQEKASKAKQAADEALYDPGNVNDYEYQKDLTNIGQGILNYSSEGYKNNTTGSVEHNYTINKMKQQASLIKGKANAALAEGTRVRQDIDQLPKYYDKTRLNEQVYDYMHPKTPDKKIDWNAIDPKKISDVAVNPYHAINVIDMYDEKSKDWAQKIRQNEIKFTNYDPNDGTADGLMIKTDGFKTIFEKPVLDAKGNVVKWVPGVTDQAAQMMMQDPEIRGQAESEMNKYIEAEVIQRAKEGDTRSARLIYDDVKRNLDENRWVTDYVKLHLERINKNEPISKTQQIATYSKPKEGGADEDFKATKVYDQKRNLNVRKEGSNTDEIKTGDIPEEYRFSGKKLDKPLLINSTKIYDESDNKTISGKEAVGDKKFYPTRTMLMAYNTKTGKYTHGSVDQMKKNPDIVFKWVVGGTMDAIEPDDEGNDKKIKKNVFMPYDEVSNDLKAQFGFDLDNRDISDISDLELSSFIKEKYPDTSPEERLKIFKKLRTQ